MDLILMDQPAPLVSGSENPNEVFSEAVVQSHSGEEPEGSGAVISRDGVDNNSESISQVPEAVTVQTEKRMRTLTQKGLEFQRTTKEKAYHRATKVLRSTIDALDMLWTDVSNADVLRRKRANLEDCRRYLQEAQGEYEQLLSGEEAQHLVHESCDVLRQAQELKSKMGDRIYDLEREETRSRQSARSSSSKGTRDSRTLKSSSESNGSGLRKKALAEAARRQVDLKYAKIESQKKMELVARECAMDELQKMKDLKERRLKQVCWGK